MRGTTRHALALAALVTLLALAALDTVAEEPKETDAVDWSARAIAAWHKTCVKCHATPDTRFETDRAFLRQITETT